MEITLTDAVKVKSIRLRSSGKNRFAMAYPAFLADDNGFGAGQEFSCFIGSKGSLLLVPQAKVEK